MKSILFFLSVVALCGCVSPTRYGATPQPGKSLTVTTVRGARFYWHEDIAAQERAAIERGLKEIADALANR